MVAAVAGAVRAAGIRRLVVDPVLLSTLGEVLLAPDALDVLRAELLPLATVVTPNLAEAAALWGHPVRDRHDMVAAAGAIGAAGPVVLLKGGHLLDEAGSPDLLWSDGETRWLETPRIDAHHTHGTGCVLSAAITAELARGRTPTEAAVTAKRFVTRAIEAGVQLGAGPGPVDPGWSRTP
jgi:hydroxymethylpyrimidine/phosphomethylpyrimidine kinase